jgi:flagellar protein FliJ
MKPFSLVGLLRLRRLQEDQAAASLATARRDVHATAAKIASVHATLASADASIATSDELFAIAATRSSSTSMLADLAQLERVQAEEVARLEDAHRDARRAARSIEKLETRHGLAVQAEELRAEQRVLDELGGRPHPEDGA